MLLHVPSYYQFQINCLNIGICNIAGVETHAVCGQLEWGMPIAESACASGHSD